MSRLKSKIKSFIFRIGSNYNNYICQRDFKSLNNYSIEIKDRYLINDFNFYEFEYKDENWNYVKKIHQLFLFRRLGIKKQILDNICVNNKVTMNTKNNILIKSVDISSEDWVYLIYNNNLSNNFCLSFSTIIYSLFTEFQIAFKHKSILERLRFRIIDNQKVVFEVVNNGYFSKPIVERPFSFVIGRKYYIELFVNEYTYSLVIDHIEVITILDKKCKFKHGGLALIFWDKKERSNINLMIDELKLESIKIGHYA
jgi:hypothetical protein